MRSNHFYMSFFQGLVQRITIVSHISNQTLGLGFGKAFRYCLLNEFNLMRTCFMCGYGDRKTIAVCNRHDLGTLATLSFSNSCAPFLAAAKLPSIKHSAKSILPLILRSTASFTNTFSQMFASTHSWKRRWQVWYDGYLSGKSLQGAPVRQIHKIPFRIARLSTRGRPEIFLSGTAASIRGQISSHWSFVTSMTGNFCNAKNYSKNYLHTNSHFWDKL